MHFHVSRSSLLGAQHVNIIHIGVGIYLFEATEHQKTQCFTSELITTCSQLPDLQESKGESMHVVGAEIRMQFLWAWGPSEFWDIS